ncbi:prepilin-type N-terminal cleavage/methylation domain-containing protein [Brockia lithotrophica]|uniref:Competence protein ComGC n=1 Tax=Brockia lithotrophica TaxID=933949 RepID=A0A660L4U6_9BACL|nr:prepilin-type N-terminal cleavage/methylation domain-containing protein [Brockia lithotrophica]RKQ88957.1 competence protein ComGC [Brockia lithotrophica]
MTQPLPEVRLRRRGSLATCVRSTLAQHTLVAPIAPGFPASDVRSSRKQNAGGFTLLEVLLVVGLLALLLWLVSPNLFSAYARGESKICTARAELLRRAVVEYMADHGGDKPAGGSTDLKEVVTELRTTGYLDGEENTPQEELLACGAGTFSLTYGDDGKPKVEWRRSGSAEAEAKK